MKVLHVLQSWHFSGAENVVCQIIKMFDQDPNVDMAYTSQDGTIRQALEERGIKFYPMKKLCHSELSRVIEQYKPDVLHGHDIRGAIESSRFSNKIKVIHTIHGNDLRMRTFSLKSVLYLLAAQRAGHIFWVSRSCLEEYKFYKLIKNKSEILYNVIDSEAVRQKSSGDKNEYHYDVVYIGRLAYPKDPKRLVKVISIVAQKLPNVKMAIIGKGDLEDEVKKTAKDLGVDKNIEFLGFMSNPYKVLHDSKIMLMTSEWEGTPMVALEAVSLGIPIVSTPTDGMKDIITNDTNGYCSNKDNILARSIVSLLVDGDKWNSFSKAQQKLNTSINNVQKYKKKIELAYKS